MISKLSIKKSELIFYNDGKLYPIKSILVNINPK